MRKLDIDKVKSETAFNGINHVQALQTAVFVMCGGGFLGRFATEQPADFYIDDRVSKLPYSRKVIKQAVAVLCAHAENEGLDTHNLSFAGFHNCGTF